MVQHNEAVRLLSAVTVVMDLYLFMLLSGLNDCDVTKASIRTALEMSDMKKESVNRNAPA